MPRLRLVPLALLACTTAAAAPHGRQPTAEPAAALTVLDEMNQWCHAQGDECSVAEMPDAHADRVASGETNGWISSHRDQLRKLGVEVVWDPSRNTFVTEVEHDLALIIGGNFAVDHLGPTVFDAIIKRARARPALYLGVLVDRVVGAAPDPGWLSSSDVPNALTVVNAAKLGKPVARKLLPLFKAALAASTPPPADDDNRDGRLRDRIAALQRLAH